ncbi:unnamed protein product [Penicillium manginii]
MDHSTHIIDPDGEVIIVLRNANSPFAHPPENNAPGDDAPGDDAPGDDAPADAPPEDDVHADAPPEDDAPEDDVPADDVPADTPPEDDTPGDGILEVKPCERMDKREFRIQVSAKHMMFASSFFKKCLTGAWKESETYQQKGLVEVTAEV